MDDGAIIHGVDEIAFGLMLAEGPYSGEFWGQLTVDGGRSNFLSANGLGVLGVGCPTLIFECNCVVLKKSSVPYGPVAITGAIAPRMAAIRIAETILRVGIDRSKRRC